jgi:hypothetical protein
MSEQIDETSPASESVNIEMPDAAWELPELAVIAILASIGLLAIAGAVNGIFYGGQLLGFQGETFWFALLSAVRWVDASTAALVLGGVGVCWWQYGQWTNALRPSDSHAVLSHVRRLHILTRGLRIAFGLMIVASIAGVVAAIVISTSTPGQFSFDFADDSQAVLAALAADVIAVVGFVGASRVFDASSVHLAQFAFPPEIDAET